MWGEGCSPGTEGENASSQGSRSRQCEGPALACWAGSRQVSPSGPEQPPASSLVPPTIEGSGGGPHVVKAVAGRPLALECVARGHPLPTLSWHHEGLPVAESNETWLEAGGSVLSLESLREASGGQYSCVASSPAGEAVLQYSVEVQGKPGTVPSESPGLWTALPIHTVCGSLQPLRGHKVVKAQRPHIAQDR